MEFYLGLNAGISITLPVLYRMRNRIISALCFGSYGLFSLINPNLLDLLSKWLFQILKYCCCIYKDATPNHNRQLLIELSEKCCIFLMILMMFAPHSRSSIIFVSSQNMTSSQYSAGWGITIVRRRNAFQFFLQRTAFSYVQFLISIYYAVWSVVLFYWK